MRIALAGSTGAGKSSLLDLISHRAAPGASAESSARGLRMAHVDVPDPRLVRLSESFRPRKTTPARLQFDDLEQKDGPAWPALAPARREMLAQADLILLVIGLHAHSPSEWNEAAAAQWREAGDEFVLLDQAVIEARQEKLHKLLKIGHKPAFPGEPELLARLRAHLEEGRPLREAGLGAEEEKLLRGYSFLSARPVLPAFNVAEEHLPEAVGRLSDAVRSNGTLLPPGVFFCAEVEKQIQELREEDREEFLHAFGLREPAVAQIIREAYHLAGLHCFFTAGEDECRAWSVRKGSAAPAAAGAIHSDLEKGFVRAEVLAFDDWVRFGSHASAREKGAVRLEGREYVVRDGDIIEFRSGLAKSR